MSLLQLLRPAATRLQLQSGSVLTSRWLARREFATVDSSDTHDDFKPKYVGGAGGDVNAQIEQDIKQNEVFVYMKGDPEAPQCGFSRMACKVLDAYGVRYGSRNVLADASIREGIKAFTSWPTIPQVFIKGEFVGGSDILYNMHQSGELEKLLGPIIEQQSKAQ